MKGLNFSCKTPYLIRRLRKLVSIESPINWLDTQPELRFMGEMLTGPLHLALAATLADDMQRNIGNEIEKNNDDFVYRHSCVMDGVELLNR